MAADLRYSHGCGRRRRHDDLNDSLGCVEAMLAAAQSDQWPREHAEHLRRWLIAAGLSADVG
jgi:hypothetical protein